MREMPQPASCFEGNMYMELPAMRDVCQEEILVGGVCEMLATSGWTT